MDNLAEHQTKVHPTMLPSSEVEEALGGLETSHAGNPNGQEASEQQEVIDL